MTQFLNWFFSGACDSKSVKRELFFIGILLALYLYMERSIMLGKSTYVHDGILWYGMFHYFVESLWSGFLPTWNPYVHGGEPFYYAWGILRLLDPVTLSVIVIAKFFNPPLFDLYHYNYIIRIVVTLAGIYLFYRRIFKRFLSLFVVMVVCLLLAESTLLSVGNIDVFSWLPWMMYFLMRMLDRSSKYDVMAFAYLCGVVFGASTYHWALPFYFIAVFLITLVLRQRKELRNVFTQDKRVVIISAALLAALSLPILSLMPERANIVPIARDYSRVEKKTQGIAGILGVDYEMMKKRDPQIGVGNPDYLLGFLPYGRHYEYPEISWAARILFVIGLLFGVHRFKWNFAALTVVMYILYIGPLKDIRLLHQILYFSFPPLWLVRHFSMFEPFVFFAGIFFIGLGADAMLEYLLKSETAGKSQFVPLPVDGGRISLRGVFVDLSIVAVAGCFFYFVVMNANFFNHFFLTFSRDWFIAVLVFSLAGIFLFFQFFKPAVKSGVLLSVMMMLIILETIVICDYHGEDGHHFKQNRDEYFSGFQFGKNASESWTLSTERVAGLNLKKTYLAYSPTILKVNASFDDLIPSKRNGQPTNITADFKMNFSQGLYHFWLKPYFILYEVAEENTPIFKKLAGIQAPLIAYFTKAVMMAVPAQFQTFKSGVIEYPPAPSAGGYEKTVLNGSFETWVDGASQRPSSWDYTQGGKNGSVRMEKIAHLKGKIGAMVAPSSEGNSMLRQSVNLKKGDAGKRAVFSIWVKSNNGERDVVQIDLQDGIGPPSISSFSKTGDWQKISASARISKGAKVLHLTCNVSSRADAPAVFDDASLTLIDEQSGWGMLTRDPAALSKALDNAVFVSGELDGDFAHLLTTVPSASGAPNGEPKDGVFKYAVRSYIPTRLELDVEGREDGVLLYRDIYDSHWEVFVDGIKHGLHRANLSFKAVPLKKGEHTVIFRYNPWFFLLAVKIYVAANLIFGAAFIINGVIVSARKKDNGTKE
ncbi:MAG: hypothetical protein HY884_05500 [Deltaproteobacteria bacterium]|nr:hypothetical protein [Deltaproteobacteria bacterium]